MQLVDLDKVKYVLEETAKYYEMDNADEWTKGIHYGLLHGLDNILDDVILDAVKEVDAIPKDQYEARLKADMAAILEEIDLQFDEICFSKKGEWKTVPEIKAEYKAIIQQKINELKADQEPTTKNDLGVDCVARQDVERFIEGFINEYTPEEELEFINLELDGLKHLPPVTPQEPKTGHWNDIPKYTDIAWQCSECEHFTTLKHSYCPNCGCRMIEPQESENT